MAAVDSPCVGICQLDMAADICIGCFRTRAEVAAWSAASDENKRDILANVRERRAAGKEGNRK